MAATRFSVFSHAFRRRAENDGTRCGEKKCFFSRTENFSPERKVLLGLTKAKNSRGNQKNVSEKAPRCSCFELQMKNHPLQGRPPYFHPVRERIGTKAK